MFFEGKASFINPETLTSLDKLFITRFNCMSMVDKQKRIQYLIEKREYDFIAKISRHDPIFRSVCLEPDFSPVWLSWWSSYGIILSGDKDKAFFDQDTGEKFDLFLGAYYYHKSMVIEKQLKESESALQLFYLQCAMNYHSIHAYQKFHQYLYTKGTSLLERYELNQENCFKLIIGNIKNLLPNHGAYAYLMLCEAYFRYGLYLNGQGSRRAALAFDAAVTACQNAAKVFIDNDPVVFNASLGGSIADSNFLSLSDFDLIEKFIKNACHLTEDEIDIATLCPTTLKARF